MIFKWKSLKEDFYDILVFISVMWLSEKEGIRLWTPK